MNIFSRLNKIILLSNDNVVLFLVTICFQALVLFGNPKSFKSQLYPAFTSLCTDPSVNVRKCVAAGFHEVSKIMRSFSQIGQSWFDHGMIWSFSLHQ
jgi:hypothetical protein